MIKTNGNVYSTKSADIWLDSIGIIHINYKQGMKINIKHAKENHIKITEASLNLKRPILADIRKTKFVSKEARDYFSKHELLKIGLAGAIIVDLPITKAMGNFFLKINRPLIDSQLFVTKTDAIEWLKKYL